MDITKRKLFFIMVLHPADGWIRVGKPYHSRSAAIEWLPIVRGSWRYMRTKISQLTVELVNGKPTEKSKRILDEKFNIGT